ncbi:MAG: hypothetical protein Q8L21_03575, partial [Candidatus Komeilibacteria bacterium]|nr:hypothetical protein [Candidatus Komeilibacteria bacterium]
MPLFFKKTFFLTLLLALALPAPLVEAANIGNTTGYAWSEKAGWIRFDGTDSAVNYGVTVSDTGLTGYAWSEKLGFINFDDAGGLYAVADDNLGNLSGYAWNEAAGFINFDDAGGLYQVVISGSTGIFSGYAWSEKTGFINFNDAGDLYAVETDWLSSYPIIQSADLLTHNDGDTIYAGQQYTWRVVLLDMNGFTDLDNVVLHLDYDGTDKTATWTEASDSFSTAAASDFFTLNSTSANSACGLAGGQADDNTCTLDFVLTMGWNWPET